MDKKINKYKLKKIKLEEKIIDILNLKKEFYENEIINLNNNKIILKKIQEFCENMNLNNKKEFILIVFGGYSVGKTTFINLLENDIKKKIKNHNSNIKIIINKDDNFFKSINNDLKNKITIIECIDDFVEQVNLKIKSLNINNIMNINIIPKNVKLLKNKFSNKIIYDMKNNISYFNIFINNLIIDQDKKNNLIQKINNLKLKSEKFKDNDFDFLDEITFYYYKKIIKISDDYNNFVNIHKYYL